MAEVIATFGAVSSFLSLVEIIAKVTKHARHVISDANALGGDVETERLAREYQSLAERTAGVLDPHPDAGDETLYRVRKQCQDEAHVLLEQLEALKIAPDLTGAKRIKEGTRKAIRAVTERQKIEHRRRHLQEPNGLFTTSLLQSILVERESQVTEALNIIRQSQGGPFKA